MCGIAQLQLGHHCSGCKEFSVKANVQISNNIPNVYLKTKKRKKERNPKNNSSFSLRNGEIIHFSIQFVKFSPPAPFILELKKQKTIKD